FDRPWCCRAGQYVYKGQGSGPGDVVKAFRAKFPRYDVEYTRFVNDERGNLKLDTALQGGVDIDVYFTYSQGALALRGPGRGWRRI
ncbi:hypothetical protein PWY36_22400, partial [Kribbella solani]|nr:hypothetical protein [Kribbella solani]